jgi:hypothetical protein
MSQITTDYDPALPEHYGSLREYLAHRVHVQRSPLKSIAADMDIAPCTLSRKLNPGDGDTQRLNVDDLERYIQVTGDTSAIEYLIAKYLANNEDRIAKAVARFEALLSDAQAALLTIKGAGK